MEKRIPNCKNEMSSFCKGSNNFQLDSLRAHDQCASHLLSVDAKVTKSKVVENMPMAAALIRMEKEALAKMEKLFNTDYYILMLSYHSLLFLVFVFFMQMFKNNHGSKESCKHISQSVKDDQTTAIKNARFCL